MNKLLAILLLVTATTSYAGNLTVQDAQIEVKNSTCVEFEVWEQPGQCGRGSRDCTSNTTKDGALTIMNNYNSYEYKATIQKYKNSCSIAILEKDFDLNK